MNNNNNIKNGLLMVVLVVSLLVGTVLFFISLIQFIMYLAGSDIEADNYNYSYIIGCVISWFIYGIAASKIPNDQK